MSLSEKKKKREVDYNFIVLIFVTVVAAVGTYMDNTVGTLGMVYSLLYSLAW
jgi:hypothetical protein